MRSGVLLEFTTEMQAVYHSGLFRAGSRETTPEDNHEQVYVPKDATRDATIPRPTPLRCDKDLRFSQCGLRGSVQGTCSRGHQKGQDQLHDRARIYRVNSCQPRHPGLFHLRRQSTSIEAHEACCFESSASHDAGGIEQVIDNRSDNDARSLQSPAPVAPAAARNVPAEQGNASQTVTESRVWHADLLQAHVLNAIWTVLYGMFCTFIWICSRCWFSLLVIVSLSTDVLQTSTWCSRLPVLMRDLLSFNCFRVLPKLGPKRSTGQTHAFVLVLQPDWIRGRWSALTFVL